MRNVLAFLLFVCLSPSWAQEAGPTHTFNLEYRQSGFDLNIGIDLDEHEFVFEKEPAYQGDNVVRAALPVGRGPAEMIGFAFDAAAKTLYLDLNRNRDLTDDPAGIVQAKTASSYFSDFKKIQIEAGSGDSRVTYELDMELASFGYCNAKVRSGWKGEFTLHGNKWRLRVVDNMDGEFGDGDIFLFERADKNSGSHGLYTRFPPKNRLFFDDCDHEFAFALKDGALEVAITESPVTLGSLTVKGESIHYLVLDGPVRAIFDAPGQHERLPLGTYVVDAVVVSDGQRNALVSEPLGVHVKVTEDAPAVLECGGPLRNTIDVERSGGTLTFSCGLVGMGQEVYNAPRDFGSIPCFVVYKGGKKIAAGNFEYG